MMCGHEITHPFTGILTLYTYFRSSCSCRVRTACHLKNIPLQFKYINLLSAEQTSPLYLSEINPNGTVPTLLIHSSTGALLGKITQSLSILEFLEETFPSPEYVSLLPPPSQWLERAKVRDLVALVACDMQPPTNLRILKQVNPLGITNQAWFAENMAKPVAAYEEVLVQTAGKYSVGDEISLADVCLAPAIENAVRWEVDLSKYPTVLRVFENSRRVEAFVKGDWRHQEDTPEGLRG
ncbi:hypothetical protein CBER1_11331 [Cercospora berteroae]|uniref:Maleylacetoacetate isomerase n=1 Tax=Cercospora berteroae TaxID=357750 RepID=A0A2S6BZX4_9PEZI|nr:hypothetical protein CBER1_11331 [Cercospora berteroae]